MYKFSKEMKVHMWVHKYTQTHTCVYVCVCMVKYNSFTKF